MAIKRNEFCNAMLGASALLILQGCGGGGTDYAASPTPAPPPAPQCGASGASIAGNHGHVLTIARADLDSLTDKTYSIMGTAPHDHTVTFTPSQLQVLKSGSSVAVISGDPSAGAAHTHQITASCV